MIRGLLLLGALALSLTARAAHPLQDQLWDLHEQRFVSPDTLFDRLPPGGWLLLGEQHDHPEHHRIQTEWIIRLAQRDQLGAVALEMADAGQQDAFDKARGKGSRVTPEDLRWQKGWDWGLYEQVVRTALDRAAAVVAADLPRGEQRKAYQEGAPEGELGEPHNAFMRELLFESHCGQLPASSLDGMRQVQLARDQTMAERLRRYSNPAMTGVMITGGIHARRDLGIPRWLNRPLVSVLMVSVENDKQAPEDYIPEGLADHLPATDYLLFTAAIPSRDYCTELAAKTQDKSPESGRQ